MKKPDYAIAYKALFGVIAVIYCIAGIAKPEYTIAGAVFWLAAVLIGRG